MAKLFYTLEEACSKLSKTEEDVRAMAQSGQLEEMRDGDQIMFRCAQVDLLVVDGESEVTVNEIDLDLSEEDSSLALDMSGSELDAESSVAEETPSGGSGYGLSDSGAGLGSSSGLDLGGSGSGFGFDLGDTGSAAGLDLGDSAAASGIGSSFESDEDDSAETRIAEQVDDALELEEVGSGSGLLDLTRESDDTALGAELMEAVMDGDESGDFAIASESGLFDSVESVPSAESIAEAPMSLPIPATHHYDGKWSGMGVGLLLGSLIALVAIVLMFITSFLNISPKLANMITGDLMIWGGGFAAFAILAGLIGMFIGKASE